MNSTGDNYEYGDDYANAEHHRTKTSIGVKITRSPELQQHMPKSPKIYIDQISHKIDVTANIASFFKRGSLSRSKSKTKKDKKDKKSKKKNKHGHGHNTRTHGNDDNDDADSTKQDNIIRSPDSDEPNRGHTSPPTDGGGNSGMATPYTPVTKGKDGGDSSDSESESDDPSIIARNGQQQVRKTKGIPIPKNKKYRNGPKAATSIPPQSSPPPLAPFSPADAGIGLALNSMNNKSNTLSQQNPSVIIHNNKNITIPETPIDNSGSDQDDSYYSNINNNNNAKRPSNSKSGSGSKSKPKSAGAPAGTVPSADTKRQRQLTEGQKRELAVKNYNKHHQTVPRVSSNNPKELAAAAAAAQVVEPGLGVNHDAKTSVKLRSPAMNGNVMQHNKNQIQFVDVDEDDEDDLDGINNNNNNNSSQSTLPNTNLSAGYIPGSGSSAQILPSESNITNVGGGSSDANLNLPVMPHPYKMTNQDHMNIIIMILLIGIHGYMNLKKNMKKHMNIVINGFQNLQI
eukprot:CAMPEP_0201593096 /NCGR_PEP_ID=MMETSP0190_2-20130828/190817_1 /ASSEMBLY_ACC=CAM_ASM_000263 /TAXON_ID=37353 /ORGANISM="Rosalina sp." /LENGTH=512 /DNA_ID=CAMNT_0048052177 /DNA_START=983 /DNA_END=2522 /DNA_ORIENTATION=+